MDKSAHILPRNQIKARLYDRDKTVVQWAFENDLKPRTVFSILRRYGGRKISRSSVWGKNTWSVVLALADDGLAEISE